MFSRRTAWRRQRTKLDLAFAARLAAGLPVADLSASNPTTCGFNYAAQELLAPLADTRSLTYSPEPFGLLEARVAVCGYYRERGVTLPPERVCMTTSTSEAYSFLLRLLCDPGDEVLIAQPSYPLFDFLADLHDVRLVPYPLFYDHGWQVEPGALEARITARTRAIAVVHPNNPTGHAITAGERAELEAVCARHGLALIVDEVFLDYSLADRKQSAPGRQGRLHSFTRPPHRALTFVLSGLSKVAALPQMKAAWIVSSGPGTLLGEALARLELIADTFLSSSAPVQYALPAWLGAAAAMQVQIGKRTAGNLRMLDALLGAGSGAVSRLVVEAGWYAVLRVPALGDDEELAVELVEQWGVLVHPGHFYGFPGAGWLVVSLLPEPNEFVRGVQSLLACCLARMQRAGE